ncbi:hypothetical protein HPB51_004312 [Rhipicephalus microplus]|uniref:Uncharacterized protein n=1 Tax=Rhipicephalus microplus TaxID=6941 RepID=A0A9J6ELC2_RHIMP|nr:hypothetical protein HPB51_004312 [Rhipicephalus microplus]
MLTLSRCGRALARGDAGVGKVAWTGAASGRAARDRGGNQHLSHTLLSCFWEQLEQITHRKALQGKFGKPCDVLKFGGGIGQLKAAEYEQQRERHITALLVHSVRRARRRQGCPSSDMSDEAIVASIVEVSPNDSDEDDMESDNTGDPGSTVAEAAHCVNVMRVFVEKRGWRKSWLTA